MSISSGLQVLVSSLLFALPFYSLVYIYLLLIKRSQEKREIG